MSSFIPSSTQNLFKFATWIHFITHINMWVFWSWYILKFSSFLVFYRCLFLEKMWPGKNVKVYDLIIFLIKFSSEFLQFFYSDSLYHTYQCVVITSWYIFNNFLHFLYVFSVFLLRKISPGKSYQNHFKFTTWIHCIISIYMFVITSWYNHYFSAFLGVF